MKINKNAFLTELKKNLNTDCKKSPTKATTYEIHNALTRTIMGLIADNWSQSEIKKANVKQACYFSAEFLVGRAIFNNLLCLGIYDEVEEVLNSCGVKLSELEEIEDAALGNGGLGRLAACFLDSAATLNLPFGGYGIRYRYGLFKQTIENGFQCEQADNWQKYGDPWSVRCDEDIKIVKFKDQTVKAVPYDMPIIGYDTDNICNLRLWQAEPLIDFDFALFNEQKYSESVMENNSAQDISRVLYPNDDTFEGKKLRLKQQYFFCSASISDIIKSFKKNHNDFNEFPKLFTIQLNDTHPVISIPELIRQLMDDEGLSFIDSFNISRKAFNYTNHTIMAEALEKWNSELLNCVIPRIYEIIIMIQNQFVADMENLNMNKQTIDNMSIVSGNIIHMARLAIYCSSHTNGVAKIHTEILKHHELNDWYKIYPKRFQNKTNGITQRRWLGLCNRELSTLVTNLLGDNSWLTQLDKLKELNEYANDDSILIEFQKIKQIKKVELAEFIKKHDGVSIDSNSIFDIQIKRLHEYKRQLLNAFSIMMIYFGIKDGTIKDFTPTTFIFGAKAAPGYKRAKGIIKYINEISNLVNNDNEVSSLIKVVFVQNYNVSYAEKLVSGADISEQISMAGTEASGTGNMKFMLNGTVTLGTFDGANVEIVEEAGKENNYIFGATVDELKEIMPNYDPCKIYNSDASIRRVLDTLIDGTFSDGGNGIFKELYDSILYGASWHKPDHYYVLGDLKSYIQAKLNANNDYKNSLLFSKKCFINMCNSGVFSSDRTVSDYAINIWKVKPVI